MAKSRSYAISEIRELFSKTLSRLLAATKKKEVCIKKKGLERCIEKNKRK